MPRRLGYISDQPDVEGHMPRIRFRDEQGNEFEIPGDRITKVWTEDGEEVEGHVIRGRLDQEPDVEGHAIKFRRDDGTEIDLSKLSKIAFTDDDGNEQEVEGHAMKWSDLALKRDVRTLAGALDRLRVVRIT